MSCSCAPLNLRRDADLSHFVGMGNLLRVLNDKGNVPKVNLFVDFESELEKVARSRVTAFAL